MLSFSMEKEHFFFCITPQLIYWCVLLLGNENLLSGSESSCRTHLSCIINEGEAGAFQGLTHLALVSKFRDNTGHISKYSLQSGKGFYCLPSNTPFLPSD